MRRKLVALTSPNHAARWGRTQPVARLPSAPSSLQSAVLLRRWAASSAAAAAAWTPRRHPQQLPRPPLLPRPLIPQESPLSTQPRRPRSRSAATAPADNQNKRAASGHMRRAGERAGGVDGARGGSAPGTPRGMMLLWDAAVGATATADERASAWSALPVHDTLSTTQPDMNFHRPAQEPDRATTHLSGGARSTLSPSWRRAATRRAAMGGRWWAGSAATRRERWRARRRTSFWSTCNRVSSRFGIRWGGGPSRCVT